jgi:hypothetical protein
VSDKKWFKIGEAATMGVAEQAPGEPVERGPHRKRITTAGGRP